MQQDIALRTIVSGKIALAGAEDSKSLPMQLPLLILLLYI